MGFLEFLIAAGAVVIALAIGQAFSRQGTVKAALDTIGILKTQLDAVKAEVLDLRSENKSLREQVAYLREAVTQAAPVRELTDWLKQVVKDGEHRREDEHTENIQHLTRMEAALGRIESMSMKSSLYAAEAKGRDENPE